MNILSLFGGIECGRVALDRLWIPVDKYFSSEIDPYAIKITKANYPDIVHIGDVKNISYRPWCLKWKNEWCIPTDMYIGNIHLLIGGSPCQDLSIAKAWWKGLDWEKSGLFYEYVRILKEVNPKYFLLENVASMKQIDKEKITEVLKEVYPDTQVHMINSSLVSAQNRKRLYWTNIPWVTQPEDRWILLRDILEDIPMDDPRWKPLDEKYLTDSFFEKIAKWTMSLANINPSGKWMNGNIHNVDTKSPTITTNKGEWLKIVIFKEKAYPVTATYAWSCPRDFLEKHQRELVIWQFRRWAHMRIHADQENSPTLTSNMGTGWNNVPVIITPEYYWRKLTPIECERLQTLPDGYTSNVSDSRRYKAIWNGWTVDVIAHILSFITIYGH